MASGTLKDSVVEPYARALMSLAQEHDLTDRFGDDTLALITVLNESPELQQVLENPLIDLDKKKAILGDIVSDQIHPYMKNIVMLLVDRRRIGFLGAVCQQYRALLRDLKQIVLAEVTSVCDLTESQQQAVRDRVMALTGASQVELATTLNPALIGGVVIKVGSQVIDASLRGQLRRISLSLAAT